MDVISQLQQDMKSAMKAGQKERLSVIRMVLSEAKMADLKKLTPEQAVAAYAKKLAKAVEEFEKHGKAAEAEKLKSELSIVQEYLPKKASPEETTRLIDEFLASHSFTEKQFGQAMGLFMKEYGSRVDAATANQILRQRLEKR